MSQIHPKKLFFIITLVILLSIISACKNSADEQAHQAELLKKEGIEKEQTITREEKEKNMLSNDLKLLNSENRIEISLPWSKDEEVIGLLPLGETEIHEPPGHPGLCVGWTHNAKIIAVADGEITSIRIDDEVRGSNNEDLYIVRETVGQYFITYKHLGSLNPNLALGPIKKGAWIGHPMVKPEPRQTNYAFHWDIEPNMVTEIIMPERLCPLTYLDNESRQRLEAVWEKDSSEYKKRWPKICNGYYDGLDSFMGFYNRSFTSSGKLIKPGEIIYKNGQKVD